MAAPTVWLSAGAVVTFDGTSTLGRILTIDGPNITRESVPTTALDSTSHSVRPSEFVDAETVDMTYYCNATNYDTFLTHAKAGTVGALSIQYQGTDGSSYTLSNSSAFITACGLSGAAIDGNVEASLSFKGIEADGWGVA